jgi:UDP-2-acetamido-3-amino-2,3-dideoxy-glucuronate N-acetyltransferase
MEVTMYDFSVISDDRGSLVALEQNKNIPFEIKRVYYIFNTKKDVRRGFHAHKELQQVLIAVSGSCKVLLDDGKESIEVELNSPAKGLLVDKLVWHEMYDFSDDLVLMILASDYYNEEDYLRSYDSFLEYLTEKSTINKKKYFQHEKAIVESSKIGKNTRIWAFAHILPGAVIGENCNINDHTFIENDVVIGDNVTIKSGVYIWDGVRLGNNVFVGPNVTFTNDLTPRSKRYPDSFEKTLVDDHASIGANATIVAGIKIGKYAMIGAGSVVTKDIPPYTLWYGNPATFRGYVCECGQKLDERYFCQTCQKDLTKKIKSGE